MRLIFGRASNCNSYRTIRQLNCTKQGPPPRPAPRPGVHCKENVQIERLYRDPILTTGREAIPGSFIPVLIDDWIRSEDGRSRAWE
jgi:hypothetical protein